MQIVGINFSDSSIEAVELNQNWLQNINFSACSRIQLPSGYINNGIILNQVAVVEQLKQLFVQAKPQAINCKQATLSIPESQVFSRLLSFPKSSSLDQIKQTITDQLSRFVPFEPTEVFYDILSVGSRGEKSDILLVAVQKQVIEGYEKVAEQLGWTLKAIELESISSARAILDKVPAEQATLLLDIGARTTIASWFDSAGLCYSFNIALAGNYFSEQLIKQLNCTPLEAEQRKQAEGFSGKVGEILQTAFTPIIRQLLEGLTYVKTNYGLTTSAIQLLGGSAQLPNLTAFITDQTKVVTTLATLLPGLKKNGIVQLINQAGAIYYNAIGLALGVAKQYQQRPAINFYRKH